MVYVLIFSDVTVKAKDEVHLIRVNTLLVDIFHESALQVL